jgi:hypothetical protein
VEALSAAAAAEGSTTTVRVIHIVVGVGVVSQRWSPLVWAAFMGLHEVRQPFLLCPSYNQPPLPGTSSHGCRAVDACIPLPLHVSLTCDARQIVQVLLDRGAFDDYKKETRPRVVNFDDDDNSTVDGVGVFKPSKTAVISPLNWAVFKVCAVGWAMFVCVK